MKLRAIAALSVLALAAAFAPLPSVAAAGDAVSYDLSTRQFDPLSAGEYDGRLRLRVSADGIVNGTFMTTEGALSNVTGGLNGAKIWLQLGDRTPLERTFQGTFIDGKLSATAQGHGLHSWTLEGTPAGH
jgi:hypothetical protein